MAALTAQHVNVQAPDLKKTSSLRRLSGTLQCPLPRLLVALYFFFEARGSSSPSQVVGGGMVWDDIVIAPTPHEGVKRGS